jgi:hypothetical protein
LTSLAAGRPDAIVAELGDGLLGAYGVAAILGDAEIRAAFTAVILAANDPVAAWGGVRMLRERFEIEPVAVTGPATDNLAGTRIIEEQLGVPAINARLDAPRLAALVRERLEASPPGPLSHRPPVRPGEGETSDSKNGLEVPR